MVKRFNAWDSLAWVALAYIAVWLSLKITGVINTPLWLTYSPVFGAVYMAGWQMNKLNGIGREVLGLKRFQSDTIREINSIKLNCTGNHGK